MRPRPRREIICAQSSEPRDDRSFGLRRRAQLARPTLLGDPASLLALYPQRSSGVIHSHTFTG
jgi:hypothetical protein